MPDAEIVAVLAPDSPWNRSETVEGFSRSSPNEVLVSYAATESRRIGGGLCIDIGCGAARNAVPLGGLGWRVIGTDLSRPMLEAAVERSRREAADARLVFVQAPMEQLPLADASADLVVAHGIWNLATSSGQFRAALGEAARVARSGAALFVFTFSRNTLPATAAPIEGESIVFTQFSGRPQIFLTAEQLFAELDAAGFDPDPRVPLTEYNKPPGGLMRATGPVIYEAAFRRR